MVGKAKSTKERFVKVADKLFFQRGYENVSVDELCREAGKAKGLFFYYFEKKENIVKLLLQMQVERMGKTLKRRLKIGANSVEKMNMLMQALFLDEKGGPRAMYYFKGRPMPEWADSHAHALKDRYIFPLIKDTVAEGVDSGDFKETDSLQVEIIYLGISQFMHRHYAKMSDAQFAMNSLTAVTLVLEAALGLQKGTIKIIGEDGMKNEH